ncbi:hypothetical protein TRICI_002985 [Trichomonascus ciferrii]|uniref:MMS19 nucleotide excision repair protein n=1 Tax=Trichomonascus ciferrii TaxID=44093 RepID=A0A642V584_9ASCO|nr:hypothetical protein TRICI_002985 [Trichomonascus ciferrii]
MDQNAVNRYIIGSGDDNAEIIQAFAESVENDKARLVDLVQFLGDYLVEDEGETRAKATLCLVETLCALSKEKLTKQQVNVIVGFLCDRLTDEDCLKEVAIGLKAVVKMKAFSVLTNLDTILDSLNENVVMKRHVQNTRYEVFLLLEELQGMAKGSQKFISTYVNLTSGEKDPRNLLVSFQISYRILSGMDISNHVEDMFDVTFCYFPITFEPPKNDPYGITSNDLKTALRKSISANSLFASDVFPGLIEKLNSSSESVKIDALESTTACIENFSTQSIVENWQEIWDDVKYEILHGSEDEVPEYAMKVLSSLGTKLSSGNEVSSYVEAVKKESHEKLQDPQSKFAVPAGKLCACVASSSREAFHSLSTFVCNELLMKDSPNIAAQRGILQILCELMKSSKQVPNEGKGNLLLDYKDQLIDLFSKSLMGSAQSEVSLKQLAVRGIAILCSLSDLVDHSEVGLLVQYLGTAVLEEENEDLTSGALLVLRSISRDYPDVIRNGTFPAFFAQLPDDETESQQTVSQSPKRSIDFILSSLASLSASRPVFESLCIRLLSKLDVVVKSPSCTYRYPLAIISTLLAVIQKLSDDDESFAVADYAYKILFPLFTEAIKAEKTAPFRHDAVINAIGELSSLLISRSTTLHEQLMNDLFDVFVFGKSSDISSSALPLLTQTSDPSNLYQLFLMALAPISRDLALPSPPIELMEIFTATLNQTHNVFERAGYLRLLTLLGNKWVTNVDEINSRWNMPLNMTDDSMRQVEEHLSAIEVQAYVAKGLILKNHQTGISMVQNVIDVLPDDAIGGNAGKVFGVFAYDDSTLSKENGLVVRLLYKQRLFSFIVPKLIDGFKAGKNKAHYLTALSGVLRYMPSKIIIPVLPTFLPLLLESLTLPNSKVQEAAIDTILATLIDSSDMLQQHIDTIIPKLLQATLAKSTSVRVSAIKCLSALPQTISGPALEPFRKLIIHSLQTTLGDPKRDVRREAVNCRQLYFEM